jgi:hypothetical protein
MPGIRYVRAARDGGPLKGGAPRVAWGVLGANPRTVSARSAAQRLDTAGQASHLVWNPLHGEIVQLIPVLRAGRSLGGPPDQAGHAAEINNEGRLCVQIRVVASAQEPFTDGPLNRLGEIMDWLDSWHISRDWPAGPPTAFPESQLAPRSRRMWARGGHFGESQVPGQASMGPGAIDIERLTGRSAPGAVPLTRRPRREYDSPDLGALLGEQVAGAVSLTPIR